MNRPASAPLLLLLLAGAPAAAGPLADRFSAAPAPLALAGAADLPAPVDAADRVATRALAVAAADPAGADAAWSGAPVRTRAGQPRLPVEAADPTGPVLLARALWSPASEEERAAALAAAARLEPGWAALAPALLQTSGPTLRRMTADLLVDAPAPDAAPALRLAAADAEPGVRAAAMRALGGHAPELAPALLLNGAQDADPTVRAEALRSAGHAGLRSAAPAAEAALADAEASVRLAAGQALRRLDPGAFAAARPRLAQDADARVRQLAAPR